jgi:type IV secretory pathway protease TraF
MRSIVGMGIAFSLLVASASHDHLVCVVWNASPSVPVGLYRIVHRQPKLGELALVRLPDAIAEFADQRGYLPRSALLLKPVAAAAADRICRFGRDVFLRGQHIAQTRMDYPSARDLPGWQGCRTLRNRELFLLAEHPDSFDGRYFGPLLTKYVVGTAVPIWRTR